MSASRFRMSLDAPSFVPRGLAEPTAVNNLTSQMAAVNITAPETENAVIPQANITSKKDNSAALDALKNRKDHFNIIFIGHVDAGKSTVGGHILFLTGMVDDRTIEKYKRQAKEANRESWFWSWALDMYDEERSKGKTVDYGRGFFETNERRFTILDAPGHKSFVPNMIMGTSQADIGVLVVSARKGEFETGFERGGQTREHVQLARIAGIKFLIIAINKMDDSTVNWSKERYDEIVHKVKPFLKGTGYNPETDLKFMPISGQTGVNLKDRNTKEICPWYKEESLLEYLNGMKALERKVDKSFCMPISGKYKDMGTVITGKIEAGFIQKGDTIRIMPNDHVAEVISVFADEGDETVQIAACGDNAKLRIKGIEEEEISIGFVACDYTNPIPTCTTFEAQLSLLDVKNILAAGYMSVMHIHACVEEVTIDRIIAILDRKLQVKQASPMFARKGDIISVVLKSSGVICAETFKNIPELARFTLRDEGKTVAMGKITKLLGDVNN